MRRRLPVLVLVLGLLAPASAQADDDPLAPGCYDAAVKARPGLDRSYELWCTRATNAVLVVPPLHGLLTDVVLESPSLTFDYRGAPGVTGADGFDLLMSGPGGTRMVHVAIDVIASDVNTAPQCPPETISERSDGSSPREVSFQVLCSDAEGDDFTVTGSGPGTFLDKPVQHEPRRALHMRYRTATAAGHEDASYVATDDLGAASTPAPLSIEVGPAVDHRPECVPNPSTPPDFHVFMHPGVDRRFAVICTDPDGDDVTPVLRGGPSRGTLTRFDVGSAANGFWGLQRWIDVGYSPSSSFVGEDAVDVGVTGPRGDGDDLHLALRARDLSENDGIGCGWSAPRSVGGAPADLELGCSDLDGDPLTATIVARPHDGTIDDPVMTEDRYGTEQVTLRYTPRAGFTGADAVAVDIADGHGQSMRVTSDLYAVPTEQAPAQSPVYVTPPTHPIATLPTSPSLPPVVPVTPVKASATGPVAAQISAVLAARSRTALSTPNVRLLQRLPNGASVYAPTQSPRAGTHSAFAIACPLACTASVTSRLIGTSGRAARAKTTRVALTAGGASALALRLTAAERRTLRRRGHGRVRIVADVRLADGSRAKGTSTLTVRR